jgi:hypothetical protein
MFMCEIKLKWAGIFVKAIERSENFGFLIKLHMTPAGVIYL